MSGPRLIYLDGSTSSFNGTKKCGASDATAAIKLDGDYIYVRDDCADGRSAVAQVTWGDTHKICRNARGNGKWVRCNWDWPEKAGKQLTPGVYNGSTGYLSWDYGNSIFFSE